MCGIVGRVSGMVRLEEEGDGESRGVVWWGGVGGGIYLVVVIVMVQSLNN